MRQILGRLLALALLAAPAPVAAFERWEHSTLSNWALRLAIESQGPRLTLPEDVRRLRDRRDPRDRMSFGSLTSLADYTQDVSEILHLAPGATHLPLSEADLDWKRLEAAHEDGLAFLEATHSNRFHFQDGALEYYWNLHDRAKSLAAGGNLFPALVIEAYAVHFLQDFYAPGHVVTPRKEIAGYTSVALHDRMNRKGLRFQFDADTRAVLEPRLEGLKRILAERAPDPATPEGFALTASDVDDLRAALAKTQAALTFFGDGELEKKGAQAAFLVLATADSIGEVLASYVEKRKVENRSESCFFQGVVPVQPPPVICGDPLLDRELVRSGEPAEGDEKAPKWKVVRVARARFGRFDLSRGNLVYLSSAPWDLALLSVDGSWAPGGKAENGGAGFKVEGILGVVTFHRFKEALAASAFQKLPFSQLALSIPTVLAVGYSDRRDDQLRAKGLQLRSIFPIPRTDLQGYLRFGGERVEALGQTSWKSTAGIGFEVGYGLLYFRLGYETSVMLTSSGKLAPRDQVAFGATIMVPRSLVHSSFQGWARKVAGPFRR